MQLPEDASAQLSGASEDSRLLEEDGGASASTAALGDETHETTYEPSRSSAEGFWRQVWINVVSACIFAYFTLMASAFILWFAQMDPVNHQPLRILAYFLGSPVLALLAMRILVGVIQAIAASDDWFVRIMFLVARVAFLSILGWFYVMTWMQVSDAVVTLLLN